MNLIDTLDLYSAYNNSDDMFLLFEGYIIDNRIDKDTLNKIIIKDLGACKPITTNPDLFKMLLESFFKKYNYNISKLLDTMYLEYNPINNKKMSRVLNDREHRHSVGDIDNTDKYDTNTDDTITGEVSAYDATDYQPKDKSIDDKDVHHEGETTSDIESTVDTDKHTGESYTGKDGEVSYQSLVEQERKLSEFNIYTWIIERMRKELFLLVY